MAKQVTKEQSLNIAKQFYSEQRTSTVFKVKAATAPEFKLDYISKDAPKALNGHAFAPSATDSLGYYYVYNIGDKQGFIIVSGDDRTKPILGYSDEGAFTYENMPEHVKEFMDNYKNQIKAIMQRNDTAIYKKTTIAKSTKATAPLLTTKWGQDSPYNSKTPNYAPTGCIATAMAQVMNYHKWPIIGCGTEAYQCPAGSYTTITAYFSNTTYDWKNMLDEYGSNGNVSSEDRAAVATLMFHCGVSVNMEYAAGESLSQAYKIPTALTKYFHYDNTAKYYTKTNFSDSKWKNMIISEIDAHRPVILGGFCTSGGHAYVGDGYDANHLIHINWGWEGSSNGYFEISSLDTITNNILFNKYQDMIIGIKKPKIASDYSLFYENFSVTNNNYNALLIKNTPISISFGSREGNNKAFKGKVGIALFQDNKLFSIADSSHVITFQSHYGASQYGPYTQNFSVLFSESIPSGTYQLKPIYKSITDSVWNLSYYYAFDSGSRIENIMMTVTDSNLKFNSDSKTVICDSPGSLCSQISKTDVQRLKRLIVIGNIDQGDILRMRDLTAISYIDMKNANIFKTELALKDVINPIKINTIEENSLIGTAFANSSITNIELPANLKYIGKEAFTYCNNIKTFTIPDSITSISDSTFNGCASLSEVNFPEKLESIGKEAFAWCQKIVKINLPSKVSMINNLAFNVCSALTEINSQNPIPPTIIGIPFRHVPINAVIHVPIGSGNLYKTAYGWKDFTNIIADLPINDSKTINNQVAGDLHSHFTNNEKAIINQLTITGNLNLKDFAFIRDSLVAVLNLNISGVNLPANKIPNEAFYNKSNSSKILLSKIMLPENLISIGDSAFKDCSYLKEIPFPNDLSDLGAGAFEGCSNLTEFKIKYGGSSFTINNGVVYNSDATSLVLYPVGKKDNIFTVPSTVTSIGKSAFQSCKNLTFINLPDSLKNIGDFTFRECSNINYIFLPTKVSSIGNGTFYNCSGLKIIQSNNTTPSVIGGNLTFSGTSKDLIVKVPSVSVDKYRAAFGWKDLLRINDLPITKTVLNNLSGKLSICFTTNEINIIEQLIITGSIDARDFKTMRDNMPVLAKLDLSGATIVAYTGTAGTYDNTYGSTFPANTIPQYSFCNVTPYTPKRSLTSVILPLSVISIGDHAFWGCSGLTTITFPSSLISIHNYAFSQCSSLISIALPSSVTTIEDNAFSYCTSLTSVVLPSSLPAIGSSIFYNCSGLTSIVIPSSVTSIGSEAFEGCTVLTSVSIPNSVTSIGNYAFSNCKGMTSLLIPSSITTIGSYAFSSGLKVIKVMSTVPINLIASGVFSSVNVNTCILQVPIGTKSAYQKAIQWQNFKCMIEGEYSATKTINVSAGKLLSALTPTELFTISSLIVTGTIDARDFVTLRDSIINLSSLDLNGVDIVAYTGLGGTVESITTTVYPAKTIPQNAFCKQISSSGGKASLKSVNIPSSVNSIGSCAFVGCIGLTSITIPSSVNSIERGAFEYCAGLTSITIPNSVTSIGDYAFYYCSGLTSITIPNSLSLIADYVFYNCEGLTSVSIPNSVTLIGGYAFYGCRSLTSITIPNSVTSIGSYAFLDCSKLTSIIISNSVTSIEDYVFLYCTGLTSVTIPGSVTSIGSGAFYKCTGLISVTIPNSVTSIRDYAFYDCIHLTSIYAYPTTPVNLSSSINVFNNVNTFSSTLYVPAGSKAAYQAAMQWKDFTNIVEMTTAVPTLNDESINLYPNPVSDAMQINGISNVASLKLFDINGKLLLTRLVTNNESISVSSLSKGIYFVKLITSEGTILRKVMKK